MMGSRGCLARKQSMTQFPRVNQAIRIGKSVLRSHPRQECGRFVPTRVLIPSHQTTLLRIFALLNVKFEYVVRNVPQMLHLIDDLEHYSTFVILNTFSLMAVTSNEEEHYYLDWNNIRNSNCIFCYCTDSGFSNCSTVT